MDIVKYMILRDWIIPTCIIVVAFIIYLILCIINKLKYKNRNKK